ASSMQRISYNEPVYDQKEEFDPSLVRLNTIEKLSSYCDSLYNATYPRRSSFAIDEAYPTVATEVIRKRFYHGYSLYGFNSNYLAMAFAQVTMPGLSAIVIPDDILKYPYAACSQQSIVLMGLLQNKGYKTRSVGFSSGITGHFTFETYYDGGWHYNDPNKEPNEAVLKAYNNPSIAFLNQHPAILQRAYSQYPKEYVMEVFTNYSYGAVNTFPAPKALLFQKVCKFLSYMMWSFFLLAFIWVRKKYKRMGQPGIVKNKSRLFIFRKTPVPASYSAA
ncbi:MAG TPA: hypothetical protein VMZ03_03700, partial [Chitinophagaceae bacterium]|nr:hypothetical protein [Chitinophagaceae bacterium]